MFSRRTYPQAWMFAGVIAFAAACGGGDGDKDDAVAGGSSQGGETSNGDGGKTNLPDAGEPSETGKGGRNSEGSGGADPVGEGGGNQVPAGGMDGGETKPSDKFEGVDFEQLPLEPTEGCDGGFDLDTGALTLTIDEKSRSLLIDAFEGKLRANSFVCTASDQTPADVEAVKSLTIVGTRGSDTLIIDLLEGSLGSSLLGTAGSINVDLANGSDKFILRGTEEDDVLGCNGSADNDDNGFDLGGGVDTLTLSNAESVLMTLGPGNDKFRGAAGDVPCTLPLEIFAGPGTDELQGGIADDKLNGGDNYDEFVMGSEADGRDILNGGEDGDLVSYAERRENVRIELCMAPDKVGCALATCKCLPNNGEDAEGDVLVNIEDAEGGDGSDQIIGTEDQNELSGRGGADRIQGKGGDDKIYGDLGDDTLEGGAGDDLFLDRQGSNNLDCGDGLADIAFIGKLDKVVGKTCEILERSKE